MGITIPVKSGLWILLVLNAGSLLRQMNAIRMDKPNKAERLGDMPGFFAVRKAGNGE